MKIILAAAAIVFVAFNCIFHYCAFVVSSNEERRQRFKK